jgi:hypothetical protein
MELQHSDRRGFIEEISSINKRLREEVEETASGRGPWNFS